MSDSLWPQTSPGHTGEGSFSLLQGIFPTQGSNPGLLHCRQIHYQLSYKGSPRLLEWVAFPFSRSSWPRNWMGVSCIEGRFFSNWAIREAPYINYTSIKKKKSKNLYLFLSSRKFSANTLVKYGLPSSQSFLTGSLLGLWDIFSLSYLLPNYHLEIGKQSVSHRT